MAMTQEQLKDLIKDVTVPLIKQHASADVADVVKAAVEAALKQAPGGGMPGRVFAAADAPTLPKAEPGMKFARYVRALAGARNDKERAAKVARAWGYEDVAVALEKAEAKAMSSGDPLAGGFLVPTEFSQDVIELLRASAVVRSLNPMTMPMNSGSVKVPRITSGVSASYIGENANITKSELGTGQLTLTFKKLAALVPISNDLLRYSAPSADGIVRDDSIRALSAREDLAFIRGDGTSGTPKGLLNWVAAANKFDANATVNLANVTTDLGRAMQLIMDANITLIIQQGATGGVDVRPGWIFSPRTWRYLTTVQTSNGQYAFRDEMLRGTLWGFPYRVTTQVPQTMTAAGVTTGGTRSEVYFGAFAHAVIGESLGLIVDASQEAAYHDGTGVVAAFSQDQTVIRVIAEHDFALRHDAAFSVIQNVLWGV
jgi:HK97 family phage major capsid protein